MTIPVAIPYSPKTKTSGVTLINDDVINIDNNIEEGIYSFVNASVANPGEAVLCTNEGYDSEDPNDYETIRFTGRDTVGNQLTGVTRGVEGNQQEWASGTFIQSNPSATTLNDIRGEILTHKDELEKHMPMYEDSDPTPSDYTEGDVVLVPMDSGENDNGFWTCLPDGTQICWHFDTLAFVAGGYRLSYTWEPPKGFVGQYVAWHSPTKSDRNSAISAANIHAEVWEYHENGTVTLALRSISSIETFEEGNSCPTRMCAIGRWK